MTSGPTATAPGIMPTFAMRAALLSGVLLMLFGAPHVSARDRYRCISADGGESYTVPGTCRSSSDQRQPLTDQEAAEIAEVAGRGRPFTRCTARDGSYSKFVNGDCPSADDIRSVEYAKNPIKPAQQPQRALQEQEAPRSAPVTTLPPPSSSVAPVQVRSSGESPPAGTGRGLLVGLAVLALLALAIAWLTGRFSGDKRNPKGGTARPKWTRVEQAGDVKPTVPIKSSRISNAAPGVEKNDGLHQTAQLFLAALDEGKEVPGGLAFRSALQQSNLDYSLESLDRVDRLLRQVRAKFSPQRESWANQPGADNFSLMLAFYLGAVISRQGNLPIHWQTREQAAGLMPADSPIPEASWSRVVGVIGITACVPLGVIEGALFDEPGDMTCSAYVARLVAGLHGVSNVDENQLCTRMLDSFAADRQFEGGLAFRDELKRQNLDYSLASLQRLDQFLRVLRDELKPGYSDYVNQPDTQNFLRLVAFYIGMTVARAGTLSVKWLTFAEAKKVNVELEFQFETTTVCVLSGRWYFPLGLVTEILIQPDPARNVPGWASEILETAPPPLPSILRASMQSELVASIDAQRARAINRAGFMAAWCMFAVEGGAPGRPTVFVPGDGDKGNFIDFGFYESAESALKAADDQMESNPNKAPFQIMSFDGYANLHTGRTDALTIDLRIYAGPQSATQRAFELKIACPYRHAEDPRGFAIFSPKLLECSGDPAMNGSIFRNFYLGIEAFRAADFTWTKYLDESV